MIIVYQQWDENLGFINGNVGNYFSVVGNEYLMGMINIDELKSVIFVYYQTEVQIY